MLADQLAETATALRVAESFREVASRELIAALADGAPTDDVRLAYRHIAALEKEIAQLTAAKSAAQAAHKAAVRAPLPRRTGDERPTAAP